MNYFLIDMDWDEDGDSPCDAVWHEYKHGALHCLDGSPSLAVIWKAPPVKVQERLKRPDIYGFVHHYAVTERVRDLFVPIVCEEAEFLPLTVAGKETLFVIHPLWPVDFDEGAIVECSEVSRNIVMVEKYSFTLDPYHHKLPRHMFRMRQAKGSAARDYGCTLNNLIVSEVIKSVCEEHGLKGIVFKKVQATIKPDKVPQRTKRKK